MNDYVRGDVVGTHFRTPAAQPLDSVLNVDSTDAVVLAVNVPAIPTVAKATLQVHGKSMTDRSLTRAVLQKEAVTIDNCPTGGKQVVQHADSGWLRNSLKVNEQIVDFIRSERHHSSVAARQ